jgi:hypothetical protein
MQGEHAACREHHASQAVETRGKGPTLIFELIAKKAISKIAAERASAIKCGSVCH